MSEEKRLSDVIIDAGDEWQPDAMEDFDARVKSGEFANKTMQQIRDIYLDETIDAEQLEDEQKSIQAVIDREEAEQDND